jgi:hypothetical protein
MNPHKVTIQGKIIKDRKILYLGGQMHDTVHMDLLQSLDGLGWGQLCCLPVSSTVIASKRG